MQYKVLPYGEFAFLINFKNEISLEVHLQVKSLYQQLKKINLKGVTFLIPAYSSITVGFNPNEVDGSFLKMFLENTKFDISKRN